MTKEEIIKMAREAGMFVHKEVQPEILAFANLVAAAEREECAKLCEGRIGGAVQANDWWAGFKNAMSQCAAAIRARSQS
jgi:hypothetical protein